MSARDGGPRTLLSATPKQHASVHRLSTGEEVLLPDREELYAELTLRNRGLIGNAEQMTLRRSTILVAGCGAIGGATIEPLVRAGAETFILAEPGTYDYNNANRQNVRIQDIGKNKASAFAEKMPDINPFVSFEVHTDGITEENVADLVSRADLIIDGVDVTEPPAILAKFALHREAKRFGKPVVGGYDIAGTQWMPFYDYRKSSQKLLDGRISETDLPSLSPLDFLSRLISPLKIPIEMVPEIERQLRGQSVFMPQLGYTALQFGVLVVRMAFDVLMERPVKRSVLIDIPNEIRTTKERVTTAGKRLAMLYIVNNRMRGLKRAGRLGVYSPMDDELFAELRGFMDEREWGPGSVIVRQGDPGDSFFVIAEGDVQVERSSAATGGEPEVVARLGAGDYFGELALLSDEPRNASVVASTVCRTFELSRPSFEEFLRESAPADRHIRRSASSRRVPAG
ncbi:MAG TPA: ThiF family adenylyltransferase [Thermomicrobiales bacterium]|nr:ThiF family adenylyltransferase [Thermomicrobiales bacterium]